MRNAAAILALAILALPSVAQHVIIIDAGSTGSRIRIYRKEGRGLAEVIVQKATIETEPGISAYQSNPVGAGPSLQALLDTAAAVIPKDEQRSTPLWIKATAGMRLVPRDKLDAIFAALGAYLGDPLNCPVKFMGTEVLGGEEEAVFAWMSMNSMLGTVFNATHTHGILDLGGASSQIAFQPGADIMSNEFSFYIDGMRRSVYAKSFIKFGLNEALARAKTAALKSAPTGDAAVDFPCFNKDFDEFVQVAGRNVTFKGTGDADGCLRLVRSLLGLDLECLLPPCAMMGTHISAFPPEMRFYGLAAYFHVANGLGLMGSNPSKALTPAEVKAAARNFCEMPMAAAQAFSPVPWKYQKYNGCFGGFYVYSNLKEYGFKDDSTSLTFINKLDGKSADWSMGAALYETQYMPVRLPTRMEICAPEGAAGATGAVALHETPSTQALARAAGASWAPWVAGGAALAALFAVAAGLLVRAKLGLSRGVEAAFTSLED